MTFFTLILFLAGPANSERASDRPRTLASTKVYETEHLHFVFARGFQEHMPALAKRAESFVVNLERNWSVRLPKRKIQVNLDGRWPSGATWSHLNGPSWLFARYDATYGRIELRTRDLDHFQLKPVIRELNHQVIHYVLNIKRSSSLPFFLEEGIAAHYAGFSHNQDRLSAVVGFAKAPNLHSWLESEKTFRNRNNFHYGAAIGRRFVAWLWRTKPEGEIAFLQRFLGGASPSSALAAAGFAKVPILLSDFDTQVRPDYKLYHALLAVDFWVILIGLLLLFYMALQVALAFRTSRMTWREIEVSQIESVPERLFSGPAFSAMGEELAVDRDLLPIAPAETLPGQNRPDAEPDNPFEGVELELDSVFDRLDTSFETPADLGYGADEDDLIGAVDSSFQNLVGDGQGPVGDAPGEKKMPLAAAPAKKGKTDKPAESEEIEKRIDDLFGDWDS